ncbi:nucleoside diphosphate kinase, partial [Cunninghamella echinulata]
ERTLALIKPDAMQANHQDAILEKINTSGYTIVDKKQVHLSLHQAELFYHEHENKPFYKDLTQWMSSGPIYALILEKENAIQDWRNLMGPTDSNKAREINPDSIRALFGTDGSQNATHGSDSAISFQREVNIIF